MRDFVAFGLRQISPPPREEGSGVEGRIRRRDVASPHPRPLPIKGRGGLATASIAIAATTWVTAAPALAQFQPSRPIEIVAHGGPGSGNDLFARTLAQLMDQEKLVPVRVQVANKPGGGSTTASAYLAAKAGDSHQLAV